MRGLAALASAFLLIAGCASTTSTGPASTTPSGAASSAPATSINTSPGPMATDGAVIDGKYFASDVDTSVDGEHLVVKATSLPDHRSVYWPTSSPLYEEYNGPNANFRKNPNTIQQNDVTFRIPLQPQVAATPSATPLGPIGIAINGVPFFNQYAGPGQPLTNEINSFDQHNGHPQQQGQYHYHLEPTHMTGELGRDALLGFLLDGYPVYGPVEDGTTLVSADLDAQHGHSHDTDDFGVVYHYHFTADAPYLNGNGFHGVPGTRS